jgi:hypothetical protein
MSRSCWFLLVVACASPAAPPAPQAPAAPPSIDEPACKKFATELHRHCTTEEQRTLSYCETLVRLVARSACDQQARASYDCGLNSVTYCTNAACCDKAIGGCDDIDTAFTACLNVYCDKHRGADPDCASVPADTPPPAPLAPGTGTPAPAPPAPAAAPPPGSPV